MRRRQSIYVESIHFDVVGVEVCLVGVNTIYYVKFVFWLLLYVLRVKNINRTLEQLEDGTEPCSTGNKNLKITNAMDNRSVWGKLKFAENWWVQRHKISRLKVYSQWFKINVYTKLLNNYVLRIKIISILSTKHARNITDSSNNNPSLTYWRLILTIYQLFWQLPYLNLCNYLTCLKWYMLGIVTTVCLNS